MPRQRICSAWSGDWTLCLPTADLAAYFLRSPRLCLRVNASDTMAEMKSGVSNMVARSECARQNFSQSRKRIKQMELYFSICAENESVPRDLLMSDDARCESHWQSGNIDLMRPCLARVGSEA